ncbi:MULTISPECIES: efflux RND transporter periplasmic adaptor subunit [unclassified Corynebacterium]|uniref:efflux RND transporter periplasmic adaptor subunit n=1 Tax=unclassified Corynebacterium TaxID=2624378 RepID=UPI001EF4E5D7|nr:efflux RND transporter periplasmic adaptor subunit [Corynebacterium sp. ACRPZ]MCG7294377.1 efflux RND transporter periplasmic adaptor subunit [Corynebacterium sp. ACRPY]
MTTAALFLGACGFGGGGDDNAEGAGLNPGDYTVTTNEGVSDSVVVNGTIEPIRSVNISTAVQSEVEKVAVKAGDRVQPQQFLASMNSEQLERQLEVQQKQQANAQADAQAQVDQARAALNAHQESVNNGTNEAIRAAQAQVNQAQAAYDAAVAANGGARIVNRGIAAVERAAGGISSDLGIRTAPPAQPAAPKAPEAPAAPAMPGQPGTPGTPGQPGTPGELSPEQLAQLTGESGAGGAGGGAAVGPGMSVEEASAALQDAKAALAAAQSAAAQEGNQLQAQLDSAVRQAETAELGDGDGTLEYQVRESTIYAPMAGLVTSVDVREGDIPQGKLLTIADDSRLVIRTDVRESDVPNIKEGDRVEFTTAATGKKTFKGRVTRIAPASDSVASGNQNPMQGMPQQQGNNKSNEVTFPVEIEVTGDKEGLLLGGSARAEIITAEAKDALNVPLDAVYGEDNDQKVLVLATDGDDATSGTVEERSVKTGASNDVDVAVTGGELKPGDIVINWPEEYEDRVGENVEITDPNFNPDQVRQAREKKERTTATVTVTSTRRAAEGQQ